MRAHIARTRRAPAEGSEYARSCAPYIHLHLYRDLAVFAEVGLLAGKPRLGEFVSGNCPACRAVPQFGGRGGDAQHTYVWIVGTLPPRVVGLLPNLCRLRVVAHNFSAR